MGGDNDDSGDEDAAASMQAQLAQMLGPIQKKIKKVEWSVAALGGKLDDVKEASDKAIPAVREEVAAAASSTAVKLERVQSELAQCASKNMIEVMRQEHASNEERLRKLLDEQRGKTAASELIVQGLEARLSTMEQAMRANELRVNGEVSAATAQLSQLSASLERQKGEVDARVGESSNRAAAQHDALQQRLSQADDERRKLVADLVTKADLAEIQATASRRAEEGSASLSAAQQQSLANAEAIAALDARLDTLASVEALEKVHQRAETLHSEMKTGFANLEATGVTDRISWEDRMMQRQHALESAAVEARRDWHRLSAQLEQVQTFVADRALRQEHDDLVSTVEALREASASRDEVALVESAAKAAASGDAFVVLEAEVRSLQACAKADAAVNAEAFSRAADADAFAALDERVQAMQQQLDAKFGSQEAHFALSSKLEKSMGDQVFAELTAMKHRLDCFVDKVNSFDLSVSRADSASELSSGLVVELRSQVDVLTRQQRDATDEAKARESDIHDLVSAVRALTCDAEMRCSLDEREIEFLWAAPGHIYGAHGWRPNNGSKSERTSYPVGNFKVATRHGSEGNAQEVLHRRKKWLNSITIGRRATDAEELDAMRASFPEPGVPVRLPDIDEFNRRASPHHYGSPETPSSVMTSAACDSSLSHSPGGHSGSGVLSPAHQMLSKHPLASLSGGVMGGFGLPQPVPPGDSPPGARSPGRHRMQAPWDAIQPEYNMGLGGGGASPSVPVSGLRGRM